MTEQLTQLAGIMESLSEVQEDSTVPRNVRTKIDTMIKTLQEKTEISIKVNKVMGELGEISNDVNLQSYTRTQIWNVMSILEKID